MLECGYCSFADERELSLEIPDDAAGAGGPYRDTKKKRARKNRLSLDLSRALVGYPLGSFGMDQLRASWARQPMLEASLADVEWERVWMASWLALLFVKDGDPLRARVALEATLETTKTQPYRALLLAQLAQHAAFLGATDLAEKWLAACPKLPIAELDSEIEAARAMIAWTQGLVEEVREMTGGRLPGAGFSGGAIALAGALNLAAHDRLGDTMATDAAIADAAARNIFVLGGIHMAAFRLDCPRVKHLARRARIRSACVSAGTFAAALVTANALAYRCEWNVALGGAAAGAAIAAFFDWTTFLWRLGGGRLRAKIDVVFLTAWIVAGVLWLEQHRAPPSAPESSESPAPESTAPMVPAPRATPTVLFIGADPLTGEPTLLGTDGGARPIETDVVEP